jgi:hypothetical protein
VDEKNYCRIYTSTISLYGQHLENGAVDDVLLTVREAVDSSLTIVAQQGAVRLKASETLFKQIGGSESYHRGGNTLSRGAIAGLFLSILALIVGLIALVVVSHRERRYGAPGSRASKLPLRSKLEFDIRRCCLRYFSSDASTHRGETDSIASFEKVDMLETSDKFEEDNPYLDEFDSGFSSDYDGSISTSRDYLDTRDTREIWLG